MLQRPEGESQLPLTLSKKKFRRPAAAGAAATRPLSLQPASHACLASFFARSPNWIARPTECRTQTITLTCAMLLAEHAWQKDGSDVKQGR